MAGLVGEMGRSVLLAVAVGLGLAQLLGGDGGTANKVVGLGSRELLFLEAANERNFATTLLNVAKTKEDANDEDPVDVVRNDGAVGGRVLPSEKGVENFPTVVSLWVAAVDVPDTLLNVVGTGARTILGDITTGLLREDVHLEVPNGTGEETSGNEVEEASRGDEENLDRENVTTTVDEVTNQDTGGETRNDGNGESSSGSSEGDTTNKDDKLDTFTKGGNERKQGHGVLSRPGGGLQALPNGGLLNVSGFVGVQNGLGNLDSPLFLHLVETEHGETHDGNQNGSDDGKDTFPEIFRRGPDIPS